MTVEGQTIRFAPGQLIFKEGDKGDVIFHIEQGVVEIFVGEEYEKPIGTRIIGAWIAR